MAYAVALGAIGVTHGGSNPLPPICVKKNAYVCAGVAQLVEHYLAKVVVAGSMPVSRFKLLKSLINKRGTDEDYRFSFQKSNFCRT